MNEIGMSIIGMSPALVLLIGLWLAAAEANGTMRGVGLLLCVFSMMFICWLLGQYTGHAGHQAAAETNSAIKKSGTTRLCALIT